MTSTAQRSKPLGDVPGPRGSFLFGNYLEFQKDPVRWLSETRRKYGDVVRLDAATVFVHDPQVVHSVFSMTNASFSLDNVPLAEPQRHRQHELTAHVEKWMGTRRNAVRSLQRTMLAEHLDRIGSVLRAEIARKADQELSLFDTAERFTTHALTDFCLGADEQLDEVVDAAEQLYLASADMVENDRSTRSWRRRPSKRVARQNELLRLVAERAEKRRRNGPPAHSRDLLDVLLFEQSHSESQVETVLRVILGSSAGSPGATLSWILLRLHEHPDVAAAVGAEVAALGYDPLLPATQPDGPQLPTDAMPYTAAVVKETLRLHVPSWMINRRVTKPVTLGGYTLPVGTKVAMSPYMVHRDERWWDSPDSFDPGRWLGTEQPHTPHAYIPFGAGPRYCVGHRLITFQLVLLVAELATHYRLNLPSLDNVTTKYGVLMRPVGVRGSWSPRH